MGGGGEGVVHLDSGAGTGFGWFGVVGVVRSPSDDQILWERSRGGVLPISFVDRKFGDVPSEGWRTDSQLRYLCTDDGSELGRKVEVL